LRRAVGQMEDLVHGLRRRVEGDLEVAVELERAERARDVDIDVLERELAGDALAGDEQHSDRRAVVVRKVMVEEVAELEIERDERELDRARVVGTRRLLEVDACAGG